MNGKKFLLALAVMVFFAANVNSQFEPGICGNGIFEPPEECDDGINTDVAWPTDILEVDDGACVIYETCIPVLGCINEGCLSNVCGDGFLWSSASGGTEECDWGDPSIGGSNLNSNDRCKLNCILPFCGDGYTDILPGEACDDGDTLNYNACQSDCLTINTTYCGDGIKQTPNFAGYNEDCDSGGPGDAPFPNTLDDGPCVIDFTSTPDVGCKTNVCGDGYLYSSASGGTEDCDDGNSVNNDACSNACKTNTVFCGNGILEPLGTDGVISGDDELCDDGANGDNTDQCNDDCSPTVCGDGILQPLNGESIPEECDDGDTIGFDGCSQLCQKEGPPVCGDGSLQNGGGIWNEECETGREWAQAKCFANECNPQTCQCDITSTGVKTTPAQTMQSDVFKDDTVPDSFVVTTFVLDSKRNITYNIDVSIYKSIEKEPVAKLATVTQTFAVANPPGPEFTINIHEFTDFTQTFQSLSPGSYRAHIGIELSTGELADSKDIFFTIVPSDLKVEVSETNPLLVILAALTVIGIIFRKNIKKIIQKHSLFKKKKK